MILRSQPARLTLAQGGDTLVLTLLLFHFQGRRLAVLFSPEASIRG